MQGQRGQPKQESTGRREPMSIGSVLKSTEYYLKANRQGLLAVQDSLAQVLPAELLAVVQVVGVHGGVLTLSVPDAASKCLLETLLRGRVLASLQKALPEMCLRKAKVMLT